MIGFIKTLLGISDKMETDEIGLPRVTCDIPMPKVKPPKPEKDISEPVLSFVQCVQNSPKRFDVSEDTGAYYFQRTTDPKDYKAYKLWDKVTMKGWYITGKWHLNYHFIVGYGNPTDKFYSDPFFLTEDEKDYIIKEVKLIMEYRVERKTRLEELRKERRIRDERTRLKEIYCD